MCALGLTGSPIRTDTWCRASGSGWRDRATRVVSRHEHGPDPKGKHGSSTAPTSNAAWPRNTEFVEGVWNTTLASFVAQVDMAAVNLTLGSVAPAVLCAKCLTTLPHRQALETTGGADAARVYARLDLCGLR